jgi:SAM-dependent methyltransferase
MREAVKRRVRAVVPPEVIQNVKVVQAALATRAAREAFEHAEPGPAWLDPETLPLLQGLSPDVPAYPYDPHALWARGVERRRDISRFLSRDQPRTLELACHDGMTSGLLAEHGVSATAIDLALDHIDARARASGVELLAADAAHLPFADSRFDCVFSYNAFEHFDDPGAVLAEALRVVRPHGTLYFRFGPLYRSSYGLHAMHAITVPFCQYLWDRSVLDDYVTREGHRRIEYESLNEWTVQQFRDLWARGAPWAERIAYREIPDLHGMDLVRDHPSCFRDQTDRFDDLLLAIIEVALKRTERPLDPENRATLSCRAS